ncbi:hypothetical protein NMY22_g13279 [Coprinellus aureogranulatus]|nr:hypothetical protein NMY22_g13279 [Coprinellus aureogranulatus]
MQLRFLTVLAVSVLSWANQVPMVEPDTPYVPAISAKPSLADLLTIESSTSIFYSYARELELSQGLSNKDMKLTLFAPTNKAVMALARKPHEGDNVEAPIEITEEEYDSYAKSNVERWVSAHIIPEAPISLEGSQDTLLPGKSITFKPIGKSSQGPVWSRVSLEGGIRITAKKEALNGDLYIIDGTISPGKAD